MFNRFFRLSVPVKEPAHTKSVQLAAADAPTEETILHGRALSDTSEYRDRYDYDRDDILLKALTAWRVNPMARRGVELTTQFILGSGMVITSKDTKANKFLKDWQEHPSNDIAGQLSSWADELWRSGNLFLLASVDSSGMTYYRPIPAEMIKDLETYANDPYRLKRITLKDMDQSTYPAYKAGSKQRTFVLHFPINRPAGAEWGESDLAPILRYISLYTDWLIDRAALNKYMKPSYIVQKNFNSDPEKRAYANTLRPPVPGSTTIADTDEIWGTIEANLGAFDAAQDGLAIKKMIATGFGFPLHYFAEPESSTRTTAEASGTPTFRRLQQRQLWFIQILNKLARISLAVASRLDSSLNPSAIIDIAAPDISERDNAQMAMSGQRIAAALMPLFDVIGAEEIVKMIYRFTGESEIPIIIKGARPLGIKDSSQDGAPPNKDPSDPQDEPEL